MFFVASKIGWILLQPSTALILCVLAGICLCSTPFQRFARSFTRGVGAILAICALTPIGVLLIRPLEDHFPWPALEEIGEPTGIIVLGGALDPSLTRARGPAALSTSGARVMEVAAIAYRFPRARLVFTGGSSALLGGGVPEGDVAEELFIRLGIPKERVAIERRSRNTYENAAFTHEILRPKPGERWIVVTSAFHMPRTIAVFDKVGFPVTPYPVAYYTRGDPSDYWTYAFAPLAALGLVDVAVKEWVGLAVYWLTGRTDSLLPAR